MKLGMRSKLFLVSLGLITLSVVVADAYLTRAIDAKMTERIRDDLFVRVALLEDAASTSEASLADLSAWDALADRFGGRAQVRATVVRRDGVVLGDDELDGNELLGVENHADRPEVMAAIARGRGSSMRWSTTVSRRMLYVAVPFHRDGSIAGVVRLSMPLTEVDRAISGWRRLVGGATILALLAAAAMSSLAAHLVSRSTRALTETALRMAAGDLDARTRATGSDEIGDLGRALDTMASTLATTLGDVKAERDLLGRIMDSMKEGVLLVGADGRIRLANPALREMLLLPSDIAGRLPIEVVRNAQLQRLLEESTGAGAASSEIELGDLKPRRLLVHAARLAGEPGGRLLVFVDVTDIRRLESLRRDFVANVSHELRTPVAAVRSAAETVRAAMRRRPEEAEEFIDIIERHADRLHRLVEDLLDLAKIESRELRLRLEPVDVRQVAEQVVALFRERASSRGIRLEVDTTREVAPARADRRALDQVVSNLVDNAVKYCHEGARVTVRASSTGAAVRLAVEDTGPGIAAVHLPRLFERFYRVDAGRSRDLGGTGLGLAIVKHLVEAMGGRTTVDSVPGKGSTFAFTLPAA